MTAARRSGGGERLLLQRARPGVVLSLLRIFSGGLAAAVGAPAVIALVDRESLFAGALALPAVAMLAVWLCSRRIAIADPRRIEALIAVALAFLLAALLATPAFVLAGYAPVDALFEAISGVTTTGLSTAATVEGLPLSVHFLRVWLQWLGGFAFASMAIALIAGPGVVALRLGMANGPGDTLLGSATMRARRVLIAYLVLTAAAVGGAALVAERPAEGAMLALAAVSTGGFALADDSTGSSGLALQGLVALAFMAGAVSMTLFAEAWRKGIATMLADPEFRLLALLSAGGAAAIVAVESLRDGGIGAWDSVFTALSAQSTTGFATVRMTDHAPASIVLLILLMAIGGSLGSTAGGIKIFRVAFAMSAMRLTLARAALSPSAVSDLRVFGRKTGPIEGVEVFGLILIYLAFVAALWFALVVTGSDPLASLFDTVSAFSTVGLSAGVVSHDMPDGLKLAFAAAMMLGRLEFLAVLALVSPRSWLK